MKRGILVKATQKYDEEAEHIFEEDIIKPKSGGFFLAPRSGGSFTGLGFYLSAGNWMLIKDEHGATILLQLKDGAKV